MRIVSGILTMKNQEDTMAVIIMVIMMIIKMIQRMIHMIDMVGDIQNIMTGMILQMVVVRSWTKTSYSIYLLIRIFLNYLPQA